MYMRVTRSFVMLFLMTFDLWVWAHIVTEVVR
jgi:hypothetical protein